MALESARPAGPPGLRVPRFYVRQLDGFNARVTGAIVVLAAVIFATLLVLDATGLMALSGGETIVIGLRLFVPILIMRFWVAGGIIAMILDACDVIITDVLDIGGFGNHYAELDKILDSYYLAFELLIVFGWRNAWARIPALALFVVRIVGVVVFEVTDQHVYLFVFPNMFENWWLYVVVVMKWFPKIVPHDRRSVAIPMVALLVPKMAQEYLLHVAEAKPWEWTQAHILEPIGIDF
jgi:hypothetical protein